MWSLRPVALFLGIMILSSGVLVTAQEDVDPCLLNCVANVNGTQCAQGQWSCLCADRTYIERLNNCTYAECNKADQDTTFGTIAQICSVFGYTITYGPEATASIPSSTLIFSTQAVVSATTASLAASTGTTSRGTTTIETSLTLTSLTATLRSSSSSGSAVAATSTGGASKIRLGLSLAVLAGVKEILHYY